MSSALREILAVFSTEFDDKGIKKGEAGVESFKKTLTQLGTQLAVTAGTYFGISKVVNFGQEILGMADALAKQSQMLGVSAADLQGWQWAAQLSGSSAEEFTAAFTKFNRNMAEVAKGTGPAIDALKDFGITADDVKKKTPLELLDELAAGLEGVEDPAKRTAGFMALFGKSGAKLLPLFLEGKEGVKKLRAEVDELGMSFDEAFLEDAQEVNDNVDRLKMGVKGFATQALRPLLPLLVKWSQSAVEIVKSIVPIISKSNAGKAALVAFGAAAAMALAPLLVPLGALAAAFLILEDVLTFFGDADSLSVTGDLIEKYFGAGASDKIREFANTLAADVVPVVKEALAIFTGGDPLDVKFQRLDDTINKLGSGSRAVFSELVTNIKNTMLVAQGLIQVFKSLYDIFTTLPGGNSIFNAGDFSPRALTDQSEKDRHEFDQAQRTGRRVANAQDFQAGIDAGPWYKKLLANVVGFKAEDAVPLGPQARSLSAATASFDPQVMFAQQQIASAPFSSTPAPAPVVSQSVQAPITQNFYGIEKAADAGRAAAKGAKSGVTEGGEYLRTQRSLVPSPR